MKRFKHLLLVLPDETPTDDLLAWANVLAHESEAERIDLLCCEEELLSEFPNAPEASASTAPYADEIKSAATKHLSGLNYEIHNKTGSPLREALGMLSSGTYDLVLTSLHDTEARVLAERLARKSPAGVLAIPPGAKVPPSTVITAIDFSPMSPLCIDWTEAFSTLNKQNPVHKEAFHAMQANVPTRATLTLHETDLKEWVRNGAEQQMKELLDKHARDKTTWHTTFMESTFPAFDLMDRVEDAIDPLLIIGSHGRNAFSVALLGSQACEVIRSGKTPVLVTKRKNDNLRFLRELLGMSQDKSAH